MVYGLAICGNDSRHILPVPQSTHSMCIFCPTNTFKSKFSSFSILNGIKKKQIITCKNLKTINIWHFCQKIDDCHSKPPASNNQQIAWSINQLMEAAVVCRQPAVANWLSDEAAGMFRGMKWATGVNASAPRRRETHAINVGTVVKLFWERDSRDTCEWHPYIWRGVTGSHGWMSDNTSRLQSQRNHIGKHLIPFYFWKHK